MSMRDNEKSKPYRIPTPLIIKSASPITITNGKMTIVHSGNIVFHGDSVEFELEETKKGASIEQFTNRVQPTTPTLVIPPPELPEGYKFIFETKAKVSRGTKRSRYETYKRDRDLSYVTYILRNGNRKPLYLGSLLDSESVISRALRELSKNPSFLRSDLNTDQMPIGLAHGQVMKACLDILEKEGFFEKTPMQVGKKRIIDKYTRTEKKIG